MQYGKSIFQKKPKDAQAVVFLPENYGACPDGIGDNAAALQKAIDEVAKMQLHGIILIPEGNYRFAETVQLWRGIRLIGYGTHRPKFFLADRTPGYDGAAREKKYVIHFRDDMPQEGETLFDGLNTSFFGGIRNIDFDLGKENPNAIACRYRIAQLCSLEDMDFYIVI